MIRFANGNSAASPTLNINSLGAKNITFNSLSLNNTALPSAMAPNTYLILQYTGSSWTVMSGYSNHILISPYKYQVERVTSLNRSYSEPVVEYLLATSSTTTGKTPVDAHVLSLNWDNSNNYCAQLAVGAGSSTVTTPGRIFSRGQIGTATTWSDWLEVPRLSGALTNGQIIVSDETTGTALLKGGPLIGTGTTKFLREDGTWQVPSGGGGGTTYVYHGTCETAAATVEKAVTCSEFTSDKLVTGATIFVTFTATNSAAVASITLNVNGTGAKGIRYIGNGAIYTLPSAGYIIANMTYCFVYNGTYWVMTLYYNTNDQAYQVRAYYMNRFVS
jgi:hypothetical protein